MPLYTFDFAKLIMKLVEEDTYGFDSGILAGVFEGLLANLREARLPEGRDWTPCLLAERVGFEPTVRRDAQQISSLPHSTTLAPLRGRYFNRSKPVVSVRV